VMLALRHRQGWFLLGKNILENLEWIKQFLLSFFGYTNTK
jgi:hypothetical protein